MTEQQLSLQAPLRAVWSVIPDDYHVYVWLSLVVFSLLVLLVAKCFSRYVIERSECVIVRSGCVITRSGCVIARSGYVIARSSCLIVNSSSSSLHRLA